MTASILTELARARILFQQRAILAHMGVDPAMIRHLTQPTSEATTNDLSGSGFAGADVSHAIGPEQLSLDRCDNARTGLASSHITSSHGRGF